MVMSDRLKNYVIPTVFMIFALSGLVALGNWQVQRLYWKRDLIAAVTERPKLPPIAAPGPESWSDFDFDRYDYRAVFLEGRYREGEVHVFTALSQPNGQYGGQGFWIMAPFETVDGWTVMVNRGFVPGSKKDPASRPEADAAADPARVVGLVRRAGVANDFTPENNLADNQWYVRDPVAIGRHLGVAANRLAPYSVDLVAAMTPSTGLPQAGETRMSFTNSHLQYAVTWYGLALALVGVYGAFIWSNWRRRADHG